MRGKNKNVLKKRQQGTTKNESWECGGISSGSGASDEAFGGRDQAGDAGGAVVGEQMGAYFICDFIALLYVFSKSFFTLPLIY